MTVIGILRSYFSHRLAGEFDGTLCDLAAVNRWLASHGAATLPSVALASGDRPRQVYELRPDLRDAFPHAFLPCGRRAFLDWLFTHGKNEFSLKNDEIVSFLIELDRDPSQGLADTYRLTPRWQQSVPNGLSANGWPELLRWVSESECVSGNWLKEATRPGGSNRSDGLNLIGHFRLPCGVGEEVVRFAEGLERIGIPVSRRDVPAYHLTDPVAGHRPNGLEDHAVSFLKFGAAVDLRAAYARAGLHPRPGVYRVAGWSWELDSFPGEASRQLDFLDAIWTPSRFVADAAAKIAGRKPVRVMTPAIPVPVVPPNPRAQFGLDPNTFVILFTFDAGSVLERKNPFALVRAVKAAFRSDDRVTLVLKVSNGRVAPEAMAKLRQEVAEMGGRVLEGMFPRADLDALLAACDCYASLHRSEGFGFTLAEAMLLGKPSVATGYSGNLDFMTDENSFLVSHHVVELESSVGPYPAGSRWAEPVVDHAAELLRHIYRNRDASRAVGLRAKQQLEPLLDPVAAAHRIASQLKDIHTYHGKVAA